MRAKTSRTIAPGLVSTVIIVLLYTFLLYGFCRNMYLFRFDAVLSHKLLQTRYRRLCSQSRVSQNGTSADSHSSDKKKLMQPTLEEP